MIMKIKWLNTYKALSIERHKARNQQVSAAAVFICNTSIITSIITTQELWEWGIPRQEPLST